MIDLGELRAAAVDLLDDRSTSADVRVAATLPAELDSALWKYLCDAGWAGLEVPEEYGGAGASFDAVAVLLEELGRHLAVGPLWSTAVLGAGSLLVAGNPGQRERWLPGIATGRIRTTAAIAHDATMPLTARRHGAGWVIDGVAPHVLDAADADIIVLPAQTADGPLLAVVEAGTPGLAVSATPMQDITRRSASVRAAAVEVDDEAVLAHGDEAARAIHALFDRAALGVACDSLGVAVRALDTTVAYAKQRVQFDRPIGSFQAVKHRCTDMLIATETSRLAIARAVKAIVADGGADAALPVSAAKVLAGESAFSVADDALGLHGGIGFTWEHDCHLMLKRAMLSRQLFGSSRWHRRRLADLSLGPIPS